MSEQEKKEQGIVEAEGTVQDAEPEESKIRKWIDSHPKTVKWIKRIGVGTLWLGSTALAYLAGRGTNTDAIIHVPGTLDTSNDPDDEELEEEPAE